MRKISKTSRLVVKGKAKPGRGSRVKGSKATRFLGSIVRLNGKARVCVVRSLGGIGDVLMATPALRELKRRWPDLHLTYALDRHRTKDDVYFHLVENAPFIDEIIDARYVQASKYDACVDISSVCIKYERKGLKPVNRIDLFARALGLNKLSDKLPYYKVKPSEKRRAQSKVAQLRSNGKHIVALHTASFDKKRTWPIRHYHSLIQENNPNIHFLVFDFNSQSKNWNDYENVTDCSRTSVREMASLINEADLFVGPDSGPMHLAGALKCKSLCIFGAIPPEARINHYPSHEAITHKTLSCLGCWYAACPYSFKCMRALEPELVYAKILQLLGVVNE